MTHQQRQMKLFETDTTEEVSKHNDMKTLRMVDECLSQDEPIFVLRAKDIFSVMAVRNYAELVEKYGPLDYEFQERLEELAGRMRTWQQSHPTLVKYPD